MDTTTPAPEAHLPPALQADRSLLELIGDWRIHRAQQTLVWAQSDLRESLGDQNHEVDTDPLDRMKTLEDILSRGNPKSMRGAIKMLEVAHTILTHEDPDAYMADGPVVEILRGVIKALEYCDGGEPVGEFRINARKAQAAGDDGNGKIKEVADDAPAQAPDDVDDLNHNLIEGLDAINDFATALVISLAVEVEKDDSALGGVIHRIGREIKSRVDAMGGELDKLAKIARAAA